MPALVNVRYDGSEFVVTLAEISGWPIKERRYGKRSVAQMQAGRMAKQHRVRVEDDTVGEDIW